MVGKKQLAAMQTLTLVTFRHSPFEVGSRVEVNVSAEQRRAGKKKDRKKKTI
jgi:hypothetical protein